MKDLPNIADFPRSKSMNREYDYTDSLPERNTAKYRSSDTYQGPPAPIRLTERREGDYTGSVQYQSYGLQLSTDYLRKMAPSYDELRPEKVVPLGLSTYDPHFDDWIEEWPSIEAGNYAAPDHHDLPVPDPRDPLKGITEKLDRIIALLESDGHASDCATHNRCVRCFVPLDDDTESDKCPECLAKDAEATKEIAMRECAYCRRAMPVTEGRICKVCQRLGELAKTK